MTQQYIEILKSLFERKFGIAPDSVKRLPGAGSDRIYLRLSAKSGSDATSDEVSAIGTINTSAAENRAFVGFAETFRSHGILVPEIYGVSDDGLAYLQEDLGDKSLFALLGKPETRAEGEEIVATCLRNLVKMQTIPAETWTDYVFTPAWSRRLIMWDLNYFKYEYLKTTGVDFDENALEEDFETICNKLLSLPEAQMGFMYRDCQSRNIMIHRGLPYWIDFQGGRQGPCLYDAVSMLWQAKAAFSDEFRERMLRLYAEEFAKSRGITPDEVLAPLDLIVLVRTLQVLGAYGFRGLVEKKAHFIESIPNALDNLKELVAKGVCDDYPTLKEVCLKVVNDSRFVAPSDGRLNVYVSSFSYKKGYPQDYSGNGGGFVFDCRAMHNPGRYDEYKQLTGRDQPVIDFLLEKGEIVPFLDAAWQLTDPAVDRYLKRGFTSLRIAFGCTGGQHRSLYCADQTARHIAEKYSNARVILEHRERGWEKEILNP